MRELARAAMPLLAAVWLAAGCARTAPQTPPAAAAASGATASSPDVVHVAAPTAEKETDRASILGALEQVRPGGTVQFASGTYLTGEMIRVSVPGVTLLGHVAGTTLRGCDPVDFMDRAFATDNCGGLELTGGHQTVRGLTFENHFWALHLGCCFDEWPMRRTEGGHLVEGNTFRSSRSGVRVNGDWAEASIVRNNRFLDNWHSVSINGNTVHLLDNVISAPYPERVPFAGVPWDAVKLGPPMPFAGDGPGVVRHCANNVIAGNSIVGIPDGIRIEIFEPGTSCRHNVIRDNTIVVGRVGSPRAEFFIRSDETDRSFVGVPLALLNQVEAFRRAGLEWVDSEGWRRPVHADGGGDPGGESVIEDNVIEGNRIIGAEGIAIEVLHASRNRIARNTLSGISLRDPFPGNFFGPLPELGLSLEWSAANGSAMWISRGSEENEIVGSTFQDIAAHAIVLEGDRNRVEIRRAGDTVRDLGNNNRVSGPLSRSPRNPR